MFEIIFPLKSGIKKTASLVFCAAVFFFFGCNGSPGARNSSGSGSRPAWVDNPDRNFPNARYLAQTGFGSSRAEAEKNALASLSAVFGQSVQSETTSFASYAQAVRNGSIEFEENKSLESEVITSVDMDSLLGAEIPEVWFDGGRMHYAVAVMDKPRAVPLYTDLFRANERLIANLISMTPAERNTMQGYARYFLAGTIADVNRVYANVLAVLGSGTGIEPGQMKGGDEYRLQAAEIAGTIPIAVAINGDSSNGRIANAFARSLSRLGFLSGSTAGGNPRYALGGDFEITSTQTDTQGNVYLRYSLTAALRDNSGNTAILPYSAVGREGHLNESSALDLVMRTLENKITEEFGNELQNFLSVTFSSVR